MKRIYLALEELASVDAFSLSVRSKAELAKQTSIWLKAAQHRMHLTAFGVGMLAFLAGFGICWLVFVR